MARPWLSIAMPTYNGDRYIEEALTSIEREGVDGIEVIAVDDGSTDSTLEILDRFSNRLPLTVLHQEHTGNWTANTNRAMAMAAGDYVCWLHQDDIWYPGRLRRIRELIDRVPDAAWYFHSSRYIGYDGRQLGVWRCPFPQVETVLSCREIWAKLLVQCFVATCAPVFASKVLKDVGPLDESLWYSADWDFWLRLSQSGEGVFTPDPLTGYRIHRASQTTTRTVRIDEFERQQRCVLDRHLSEWRSQGGNPGVAHKASLSVTLNVALASLASGQGVDWRSILADSWRVRPWGWYRFLEESRFVERMASRWHLRREPAETFDDRRAVRCPGFQQLSK
jgi:glycosyltransferase involved in cell wall biosynthesis